MKRRDFVKRSALTGAAALGVQGCSSMGRQSASVPVNTGPGFDVHPFIKNNPDAVFIFTTNVASKGDSAQIQSIGGSLAKELIVKTQSGGYAYSTKVTVKPNWTSAGPKDGKPVFEKLGVNTDPYFVEGWVNGMKSVGAQHFYARECCCTRQWEPMGYTAMCERAGIDLTDYSTLDFWELKKGDLNFVKIPNGVVFSEVGFMSPMNEPGTFLVNIAKMKSHGMGTTAAVKNLQGISGRRFHSMCTATDAIKKTYDRRYHKFFQKNFETTIRELWEKHKKDGIPRWDRPAPENRNGMWMEQWAKRIIDSVSVTPTALNVVEGIYSQDGNGFGIGPHEKLGPYGVTSRDYMSNVVVFGIDPYRVDIVTHWLAGHEPGNFGLFHIAIERGMLDVLDPHDIPIYSWNNGRATSAKLDDFKRTPLVTYYLQRDYNGQNEPEFHLCDEPFDYSAWKRGARVGDCSPSFDVLGRDNDGNVVGQITVPKKDDVYVDVLDKNGEVLARLRAPDLEPGVHQVVWDGFCTPGLHNYYVRGMGWDDTLKEVIV